MGKLAFAITNHARATKKLAIAVRNHSTATQKLSAAIAVIEKKTRKS